MSSVICAGNKQEGWVELVTLFRFVLFVCNVKRSK